jgi:hypothetical protein
MLRTIATISIKITSDTEGKNQYIEESFFCAIVLQTFLMKLFIITLSLTLPPQGGGGKHWSVVYHHNPTLPPLIFSPRLPLRLAEESESA